jgi:hypothetical protein
MHLTREALDMWAAAEYPKTRQVSDRRTLIRLEEGDIMDIRLHPRGITNVAAGPALVELIVYRDGGWSAREMDYETPESIALAASLAQRDPR